MGDAFIFGPWALFATLAFANLVQRVAGVDGTACKEHAKAGSLLQARRSMAMIDGEDFVPEVAGIEDNFDQVPGFSPRITALLAQLQNDTSGDLNPACKRMTRAAAKPKVGTRIGSRDSLLKMRLQKVQSNASASAATCPTGQYKVMDFGASGATSTCCPASSRSCAGCASFSGTSCQKCQDGFVIRDGACMACSSSSGWLSLTGRSCFQLAQSECNDEKVRGQSSNEACCQCGGGAVTPTPFSYPNVRWALDSDISILPEPRTADRYTIDVACELAAHNLTMDSTTGTISYISGRAKPTEAFSFECEVTAHQTAAVSTTAIVVVAADQLTYKSGTLLFHNGDVEQPVLTGSGWSKFALGCAPEISWLSINSGNGHLTYASDTSSQGGLSVADEKFFGQDGAVCTVTAWKQGKQHKTSFASIRPRPWPNLEYSYLGHVKVSLGEEVLPLTVKIPSDQGLMKPWTYRMACSVSGALTSTKFTFDPVLSMGFLDGYEILEIGEDGQVIVAPESALSAVFDALDVSGSTRKVITCNCRIFGIFPDPMIAPVETTMVIKVQDVYCWVPQILKKSVAVVDAGASTQAECRARCRADASCANYRFADQCYRYDAQSDAALSHFEGVDGGQGRCCRGATSSDNSADYYTVTSVSSLDECESNCRNEPRCVGIEYTSGTHCEVWTRPGGIMASIGASACSCYRYGPTVTVIAKVTNCTNEGTCLKVTNSKGWLSGTYCPLGRDSSKGRIVYMREHVTAQDVLYMHHSSTWKEGCPYNKFILRSTSAQDFVDTATGVFELRGTVEGCVDTPDLAVRGCSTKALAWMEEEETEEEGLPSLVLDDPSTAAAEDFWLHPCDCAPPAWGTGLPVNPDSFEHVPVDSNNNFIPAPFTIVTGQLVCPSRQLLPGGVGVHFQSEEEMLEPADCEARCRNQDDCHFFWHGSQHGAATCRLFSGCDNLVREFSLEGSLQAMPRSSSCTVADAERCWATSLRRSFLTKAFSAYSGGSAASGPVFTLPANPGDPPALGMVAWFKSENAGSVWLSSVGNIEGYSIKNTVHRVVAAGYGADRPVTYIKGNHLSSFRFGQAGEVLKPTFTICSVTRYAGGQRQRILQADQANWLHGHWKGSSGVAFYQAWVTPSGKNNATYDWVVLCGSNGASTKLYELQGSPGEPVSIAIGSGLEQPSDSTLYVNAGNHEDEPSDFAVMEVITWDRALSDDEMKASVNYLKWKLRVGSALEVSEHLATEIQKNFDSFAHPQLDDIASQTFDVPLANGYRADLSGWTHTRPRARGFLKSGAGTATAVVKGLTPAAKYIYQVYMVHEVSQWEGEAKISVNHGHNAHVDQSDLNWPVLQGVAEATSAGEINFEFERGTTSGLVDLSSIAIAKVGLAFVPKPADPPAHGMVAWFKSENAGSVWPSSVGNIEGYSIKNTVHRVVAAGYGADRPVTYIKGNHLSSFRFGQAGEVLKPTFTICSVTRYAGGQRQRILQADQANWLHGHWKGSSGVAFYQAWVTPSGKNHATYDWVVLCGSNGASTKLYELQGSPGEPVSIAIGSGLEQPSDSTLYVNAGNHEDEPSDFAVMEVITWDRALSDDEMKASVNYLKWKLRVGSALEVSEHLATEIQKNFDSFAHPQLDDIASQTFDVPLANGYRADLSGWSHTRQRARGFLKSGAGKATAVVKGLTPAAKYIYQVYMVHEVSQWEGEAKISVNHGHNAHVDQSDLNWPVLQGVAEATPRGEINFEFERGTTFGHIDLSSIAIAQVAGSLSALQELAGVQLGSAASSNSGLVGSGFLHLHLYQQCDSVLLLGGMGVQQCGRPGHRKIDSHDWQHKRPLPSAFESGAVLTASCWTERYRLLKGSSMVTSERLQCVNGDWRNSLGETSLKGLACESCVQVGATGYAGFDQRNEQELYFFNRMALSVYTELGMIKELSTVAQHRYCLGKAEGHSMTVIASTGCPAVVVPLVTAKSSPETRQFKLIPDDFAFSDADECLKSRKPTNETVAGLQHVTCNVSAPKQLLLPAELPVDMWDLHIEADERTQDLHKGYSSYCGTSGALTTLDFGQLFVGEASDVVKPRSRCKFAPLIEFGEFKDTGVTRQKTSNNWNGWHDLLADNPVECLEGEALTAFKLEAGLNKYRYECSKIGGLGTCFDYYSAQVDVPSFGQEKTHWSKPMRMLTVTCGHNSVLGGFHFEFSEGGRWGRVRYQCCKAGGAPVTFDPRGQLSQLVSPFDGTYCPTARDASGRPQYGSSNEQTLTFDRDAWKWCIGSHCSADTDVASPLGLVTKTWEVVNVSDFNGEFEGHMPKEGTKGMSLQDALKMKPPKRPKAPPMPELQEFKAEQPKYAAECLNYQNLWKKVTETFKDEEDNQVEKTEKLLAEPTTEGAELDDYHPCEVAKGAGGIFGPWGGGDGSTAPENMMYADWNDCMQGDIERDLASARLDYHGALTEFIMEMVEAGGGMICDAIPDVMIAPFGTGVGMNPGKICEGAMELVGAVNTFAGPASGFHFAKQGWEIEQEGYAACNPMQIGFARAFCDIHCVRDAVIRGDRSIIRNLELATKKTNNNMAALMKWSVEAAHTETGWLADKMDYSHVINVAYLQDIHNMLTGLTGQGTEGQLMERAAIATSKMFEEMQGYAEAASFNDLSRVTARDALETFLATPDLAGAPSNATALALLGHLERLHGTLRLAARKQKEQLVERQLQQSVRQLQRQAQLQLRSLGVYRLESDASSHRTRKERHHFMSTAASLERRQVMMSMDHIWWQLRKKLDEYLSVAEEEVRSFQVSLEEMGSYMHCKKGFSSLVASYTSSMASLKRSHRQLRRAWRVGSELLGEMASVIVDAEAFQSFVAEQGCDSSLVKQTLKQLESAIFGMAFLLHRFRAAKLPEPDRYPLKEATKRIQEAYAAATSNCTS